MLSWRVAWRLGRAEARQRPPALALAFLMVSAAAAIAILSLGLSRATSAAYERVRDEAGGAHLWLFSSNPALAEAVRAQPGVEAVTPVFRRARVSLTGEGAPFPVMLWALPGGEVTTPAPAVLREGRWPAPGAAEISVDRAFAGRAGLQVGDALQLSGRGGAARVTVTGIGVNTTQAPYPLDRPPDVFGPPELLERVAGGRYEGSALGVRLADAADAPAAMQAVRASQGRVFGFTWAGIRDQINESNRPSVILLQTFAVFAFLAVGFVLANSVAAQLLGRAREIGLLRAAGLSPRQVTWLVVAQYLALSAAAAVVGVLAGTALTPLALRRVADILGTTPVAPADPAQSAVVVAGVVVAAGAFVYVPARAAGRGTVAAALQGHGAKAPRRTPLLARLAAWLHLPASVRIGLKDAFARPGRAWLTVAAIALAAATVALSLTIEATGRQIAANPAVIGRPPYQLRLTPRQQPGAPSVAAALAAVRAVPGVAGAVAERGLLGSLDGQEFFQVLGMSGDVDAMPYSVAGGRGLRAEGDALVGVTLAAESGLTPGQQFELTIRNAGRRLSLTVAGIIPDDDHDGRVVVYRDAEGSTGQLTIDVVAARGTDSGEVAKRVDAALPGAFDIDDVDGRFREDLAAQRSELRRIMVTLDGALLLVALANLLGVLILTIRERTKELGVLRALGLERRQVFAAIGSSSAVYAVLGVGAGAPAGYYVTVRLFDHFGGGNGWGTGITQAPPWPWSVLALGAAALLLAVFVAIPARMATRMSVSEALREE